MTDKPASTITQRRRQTRNRMYRFIYDSETPVTKQQLAETMGYSLPTVHQNISELLAAGLICPGECRKSTGGRPAIGYSINEKVRYSVGVAVSSTQIRILIMDICQNVLGTTAVPVHSIDGGEIGRQIEEELDKYLNQENIDKKKVLGVGITFPGVIDAEKDTIVLSPTLRMKNLSLSSVREPIPYPVFIENDSTSGGMAEWLGLSMEERKQDFVFLFLENGIGGTIFIDGHPFLGTDRRSGEFGHMCIVPNGRLCNCGKRGCLEAYCSAMRFTGEFGVTTEMFFDGLKNGKPEYTEYWDELLDYLAVGINNLRMAFNCNVILGGFVSRYLEPYLPELKRKVSERSPFEENGDYIRLGRYPTKAGMMGVAWHFMEQFIDEI